MDGLTPNQAVQSNDELRSGIPRAFRLESVQILIFSACRRWKCSHPVQAFSMRGSSGSPARRGSALAHLKRSRRCAKIVFVGCRRPSWPTSCCVTAPTFTEAPRLKDPLMKSDSGRLFLLYWPMCIPVDTPTPPHGALKPRADRPASSRERQLFSSHATVLWTARTLYFHISIYMGQS